MEPKENDKNKAGEPNAPVSKSNSNKVLLWILGGCLALLIIAGLLAAGFIYWGYKKINQAASDNGRHIEERQNAPNISEEPQDTNGPSQPSAQELLQTISEDPQATPGNSQSAEGALPFAGEKQIGYIKKVFSKAGKNYLAIDYIQWLNGAEAEKAMREDGKCPKNGECIVLDDYYIRNVNPLVRTFEISPDAEITMQTYDMEETGLIQPQKISLSQFSWIFAPKVNSRLKDVPYIVEISSNQIMKINEQYVP